MSYNAPNREFYDPPSGGISSESQQGIGYQNAKMENLRAGIGEAQDVLRQNIQKSDQADVKLNALENKTKDLAVGAGGFRNQTSRVRRMYFWKEKKWTLCVIAGIILLLIVIIVPAVLASKHKD